MDHLSTPEQQARLLRLLPAVPRYIAGLPVCADGEPDWQLYTTAKRHLSEYVGWDAEARNWPAGLSTEDQEWLRGQQAYEAMIDVLVEHIHV
jgi:hypothetical protein